VGIVLDYRASEDDFEPFADSVNPVPLLVSDKQEFIDLAKYCQSG